MNARIHRLAAEELAAAVGWYELSVPNLGEDLLAEVGRALRLLCLSPLIGRTAGDIHRLFPLQRFPFALVYRVDSE